MHLNSSGTQEGSLNTTWGFKQWLLETEPRAPRSKGEQEISNSRKVR